MTELMKGEEVLFFLALFLCFLLAASFFFFSQYLVKSLTEYINERKVFSDLKKKVLNEFPSQSVYRSRDELQRVLVDGVEVSFLMLDQALRELCREGVLVSRQSERDVEYTLNPNHEQVGAQ